MDEKVKMNNIKSSGVTRTEKKVLVALGAIAFGLVVVLVYLFSRHFLSSPYPTDSQSYLPSLSDLPVGFTMVLDKPINYSGDGNFYQRSFHNSDFISQNREVNVDYTVGYLENISDANSFVQSYVVNSSGFDGIITADKENLSPTEFSMVDNSAVIFTREVTEVGTPAINYTLVFNYQKIVGIVIVSAPVDKLNSSYESQMRSRLRRAVFFYSHFVTRNLPAQIQTNVPLPPFGEISIKPSDLLEPTKQLSSEVTGRPPQSLDALFFDDFSDEEKTKSSWKQVAGNWQVVDGKYYCRAASFWCFTLAGDPNMRDYTFSVDLQGVEGVDKFIYVGVIEGQKYYQIKFRSNPYNDLLLTEQVAGLGVNLLKTVQIENTNGNWYHLDVAAKGTSISIFVNSNLVILLNDPKILGFNGQIGLGMQYSDALGAGITSVYFDNAIVTPTR